MTSILLDTHIVLWWLSGSGRLSPLQRRHLMELEKSVESAAVSAITLRELARMVERGIVETAVPVEEYLGSIETNPSLIILPLTARIAAESVRLGNTFPKDPADQIIVATARCHSLTLMTADERIRRWGKVPIL